MMYKKTTPSKNGLKINDSFVGETIEMKVRRIVTNREPTEDPGIDLIFTDRKVGVLPDYDIRADKWDNAIDANDKATRARLAKRAEADKETGGGVSKDITPKTQDGGEPIQATKPEG